MILEEEKYQNPIQLLTESQLLKMLNVKNTDLQFGEKYFQSPWLQMERNESKGRVISGAPCLSGPRENGGGPSPALPAPSPLPLTATGHRVVAGSVSVLRLGPDLLSKMRSCPCAWGNCCYVPDNF